MGRGLLRGRKRLDPTRWTNRLAVVGALVGVVVAIGEVCLKLGWKDPDLFVFLMMVVPGWALGAAVLFGGVGSTVDGEIKKREDLRRVAAGEAGLLSTPEDDRAGAVSEVAQSGRLSRASQPPE